VHAGDRAHAGRSGAVGERVALRLCSLAATAFVPLLLVCACASPTIATQPSTVFQSTTDATQYRSPTPRDAKGPVRSPDVSGTACRTMLAFPSAPPGVFLGSNTVMQLLPWNALSIVWGDDGYATAVARAREAARGATLVDVRVDLRTTAVLGIWRRECVEVHASAL
jgi:hypothetical protein